jgi:hypothetical protein
LSRWPKSWAVSEDDIETGNKIVTVMKTFIESLVEAGLTNKTIKRHVDNLWLLGGEIIRHVNFEPDQSSKTGLELIKAEIGHDGGPYCRHLDTEAEMKSFDSTARKLHKYLDKK